MEIIDIILPIFTLIISALLTIPVFKAIRKTSHTTALTIGWLLAIFIVAGATVANLASKYYSVSASQPFVNLTLSGGTGSPTISSAFMVDAISVYMAIIIVAVSAVVMILGSHSSRRSLSNAVQEKCVNLEFHIEVFGYDYYRFSIHSFWAFHSLRFNWQPKLLGCPPSFGDFS
jgi:formate hydrogenlyase subunit 3/multisubunit Na+/H+ antiporter MnhD subunit